MKFALLLCAILFIVNNASAQINYATFKKGQNNFELSANGKSSTIYVSSNDLPGVIRAAKDLSEDIRMVTDVKPNLTTDGPPSGDQVVIIGTIGSSSLIDQLISAKRIDVTDIKGKWETFFTQVVDNPFPNVKRALVIAGSDKRGSIFGIYDLSKQIGVSPWYWWADVPPVKNKNIYVVPGRYVQGEPSVKYRGIFLNDEEPALGRWAVEKYGGFNHAFYEKLFELILRMKGNYLWPAMWWASFNTDDPTNPKLADEYGIVIGTTHHEPMNRAHKEWKPFGGKEWNYDTNADQLRTFWTQGIQRMGSLETIVSLGMRGDGDEAMTADTNIALLEKIVADQRNIITNVTGKKITETPQLWALYKEVQDYYDKGMRVPDDVTLLLCDDNWGNNRKFPKLTDAKRSGGYGIYYHFDYVGGPRNYKWLNTTQISRVWEQMHQAYDYGVDRIWLVNVGDLKPMELPIEFFLDYAWDVKKWNAGNLNAYTEQWAAEQFGGLYSKEIAQLLTGYTNFNSRRKPELLSADIYSLTNYREAERVVNDFNNLVMRAEKVYSSLPAEYKNAFYQLVLFPVKASANLNELYLTVGKNRLAASQGRAITNDLAAKGKALFANDSTLSYYYNHILSDGKWNHMMDQTHVSYTYWQQPPKDVMPAVKTIEVPATSEMGIAIENSDKWWPNDSDLIFPEFDSDNKQTYYIDIFNRGTLPFDYSIASDKAWIKIEGPSGKVEKEKRISVSVNWVSVPAGISNASVTITGPDKKSAVVKTIVRKGSPNTKPKIFVESNGYVSVEAEHYSRAVNEGNITWKTIPNIGRTLSGVTPSPETSPTQTAGGNSPHLEYDMNFYDGGEVNIKVYLSPTLNFHNTEGRRYAISIDEEAPQIINIHEDKSLKAWERWVSDNVIIKTSKHNINKPGIHTLKFWMIDSGIVLQKIVVEALPVKPSYLGPPESYRTPLKVNK